MHRRCTRGPRLEAPTRFCQTCRYWDFIVQASLPRFERHRRRSCRSLGEQHLGFGSACQPLPQQYLPTTPSVNGTRTWGRPVSGQCGAWVTGCVRGSDGRFLFLFVVRFYIYRFQTVIHCIQKHLEIAGGGAGVCYRSPVLPCIPLMGHCLTDQDLCS